MERFIVLFNNCLGEREVPEREAMFWASIGLFVMVLVPGEHGTWHTNGFLYVAADGSSRAS